MRVSIYKTGLFCTKTRYLALIDRDRQWLKSSVGNLNCEVNREIAFCSHTILQNRLLVVPDAREDPRFSGNPLVEGEPFIRFYAGVPVASPEGHNLGTLCVADTEPRDLNPEELHVLEAIAATVQGVINGQPSVFVSYSHRDEEWKKRLVDHLRVLQEQKLLLLWDDTRIDAGEDWRREIRDAMESSTVAILLVSANLLTSRFVLDMEVPNLLRRRDKEGLHILPLLVKPCCWDCVDWLKQMSLYPSDANPLSGVPEHELEKALTSFAAVVLRKSKQGLRTVTRPPASKVTIKKTTTNCPEDSLEREGHQRNAPGRLQVKLKKKEGPTSEVLVFDKERITIGRAPSCDMVVSDPDRLASRQHAEITVQGEAFFVSDLGSKNFIYFNQVQLEPGTL